MNPAAKRHSCFLHGTGFADGVEGPVDGEGLVPGQRMWGSTHIWPGGYPVVVALDGPFLLVGFLFRQPSLVGGFVFFIRYFFHGDGRPPFHRLGTNDFRSHGFLVVQSRPRIFIWASRRSDGGEVPSSVLTLIRYFVAVPSRDRRCARVLLVE